MRGIVKFVVVLLLSVLAIGSARAEAIKIGMTKLTAASPFYIAQEKGYFTAEGLTAELVFIDAAQTIAIAVTGGQLDFGGAGTSAAFFNMGGKGGLRIIAGQTREMPGFPSVAYIVSNHAYAGGLKELKDFAGHSVAVTQSGSSYDYAIGVLADKFKFDINSIRFMPLQTQPNIVSALAGGQADGAALAGTLAKPMDQRGDAKILGWGGEVTPWQASLVYTAAKTADSKHDMVERFLRAYRKATQDFHDAFIGADGLRHDGPTAAATLAIISKYNGLSIEQVKEIIPYIDAKGRLDVKNVRHQIDWFRSRNMIKGDIDANEMIDKRYATPLP